MPPVFEAADNRLIQPRNSLQEVVRHRTFFVYWVWRNISARYRQTTLGPIWTLVLISGPSNRRGPLCRLRDHEPRAVDVRDADDPHGPGGVARQPRSDQ